MASKVRGWEIGLTPVTVPKVKHVVACLDALEVASQLGPSVSSVVASGCCLMRLEYTSPLAILAVTKHAGVPDPVLGCILLIQCLLLR